MALVIYDHGYRIQTPTRSEFPPGGVNKLTALRASHSAASREDNVHADGHKFIQRLGAEKKQDPAATPATQAYVDTEEKTVSLPDRRSLVLSHIMVSPVQVISSTATVFGASRKMDEYDILHLVVVNEEMQLLGMLSRSDLQRAEKNTSQSIEAFYSKQVIAALPDTQVRQVAQSFVENKINAMPVVDSTDKVVGIITRTDLLHLLVSGPNLERWA